MIKGIFRPLRDKITTEKEIQDPQKNLDHKTSGGEARRVLGMNGSTTPATIMIDVDTTIETEIEANNIKIEIEVLGLP